jgi:hypothetical protein
LQQSTDQVKSGHRRLGVFVVLLQVHSPAPLPTAGSSSREVHASGTNALPGLMTMHACHNVPSQAPVSTHVMMMTMMMGAG